MCVCVCVWVGQGTLCHSLLIAVMVSATYKRRRIREYGMMVSRRVIESGRHERDAGVSEREIDQMTALLDTCVLGWLIDRQRQRTAQTIFLTFSCSCRAVLIKMTVCVGVGVASCSVGIITVATGLSHSILTRRVRARA